MKPGNHPWGKPMGTATKLSHHGICCKYYVDLTSLLTPVLCHVPSQTADLQYRFTLCWCGAPFKPLRLNASRKKKELPVSYLRLMTARFQFRQRLLNGTTLLIRPRRGYLSGYSTGWRLWRALKSSTDGIATDLPNRFQQDISPSLLLAVNWVSSEICVGRTVWEHGITFVVRSISNNSNNVILFTGEKSVPAHSVTIQYKGKICWDVDFCMGPEVGTGRKWF